MTNLIDHIGILVPDLEAAIAQWSALTGYTFSPIARYRTDSYEDHSSGVPHFHDARISMSREGGPHIELMEFHGAGTHSPRQGAGMHHIAFLVDRDDVSRHVDRMAEIGVAIDGNVLAQDGSSILCFTDPAKLNGIRLEFVAKVAHPVVADDGSALPVGADGMPSFWPVEDH